MSNRIPTQQEQNVAWQLIAKRSATLDWSPPVTTDEIDRLLARMPTRNDAEPLMDWLWRAFGQPEAGAAAPPSAPARILPFVRPPCGRFRPLGQILAWAAAAVDDAPPSLPERLDIGPGVFRVAFAGDRQRIRVTLEALGFTLARLAGRTVAVTGPEGLTQLLAMVTLDARGEGSFELEDTVEIRRLLLCLQVGEIEPS
ncbi:hypothetical protein [Thiocystis violacea]|uniref:hypothetical protein n=1 Tax=Thiocystis violacea TaxID=13725 RepID=UPI0019084286|nr:hypothetical protein [Thiocystis violacea]MBK1720090.1 hypothetical protein [Thiocystis violacea]